MNDSKPFLADVVDQGARGQKHGTVGHLTHTERNAPGVPHLLHCLTHRQDPEGTPVSRREDEHLRKGQGRERTQITDTSDQIPKHPFGKSPHFHLLTQEV